MGGKGPAQTALDGISRDLTGRSEEQTTSEPPLIMISALSRGGGAPKCSGHVSAFQNIGSYFSLAHEAQGVSLQGLRLLSTHLPPSRLWHLGWGF